MAINTKSLTISNIKSKRWEIRPWFYVVSVNIRSFCGVAICAFKRISSKNRKPPLFYLRAKQRSSFCCSALPIACESSFIIFFFATVRTKCTILQNMRKLDSASLAFVESIDSFCNPTAFDGAKPEFRFTWPKIHSRFANFAFLENFCFSGKSCTVLCSARSRTTNLRHALWRKFYFAYNTSSKIWDNPFHAMNFA
jgi:hypothetical protein